MSTVYEVACIASPNGLKLFKPGSGRQIVEYHVLIWTQMLTENDVQPYHNENQNQPFNPQFQKLSRPTQDLKHPIQLYALHELYKLVCRGVKVSNIKSQQYNPATQTTMFISQLYSVSESVDIAQAMIARGALKFSNLKQFGPAPMPYFYALGEAQRGRRGAFSAYNLVQYKFHSKPTIDFFRTILFKPTPCKIYCMRSSALKCYVSYTDAQKVVHCFKVEPLGLFSSYESTTKLLSLNMLKDSSFIPHQYSVCDSLSYKNAQELELAMYELFRPVEYNLYMTLVGLRVNSKRGLLPIGYFSKLSESKTYNTHLLEKGVCSFSESYKYVDFSIDLEYQMKNPPRAQRTCQPPIDSDYFNKQTIQKDLKMIEKQFLEAERSAIQEKKGVWKQSMEPVILPRTNLKKRRHLIIDHSNLWIGGMRISGKLKNMQQTDDKVPEYYRSDPLWRVHYARLLKLFDWNKEVDPKPVLIGSLPPSYEKVFQSINTFDIHTQQFLRDLNDHEKQVDNVVQHQLYTVISSETPQTCEIILFSGDRDFEAALQHAISKGFRVHVAAWGSYAARAIKAIPGITFISLEPFFQQLSFLGGLPMPDTASNDVYNVPRDAFDIMCRNSQWIMNENYWILASGVDTHNNPVIHARLCDEKFKQRTMELLQQHTVPVPENNEKIELEESTGPIEKKFEGLNVTETPAASQTQKELEEQLQYVPLPAKLAQLLQQKPEETPKSESPPIPETPNLVTVKIYLGAKFRNREFSPKTTIQELRTTLYNEKPDLVGSKVLYRKNGDVPLDNTVTLASLQSQTATIELELKEIPDDEW